METIVSPSILAADFNVLGQQIQEVEKSDAKYLHIDVMDGVFVDNITYGNNVVAAIRSKSDIFFDTHLMVTDPTNLIPLFAKAGSDMLTIHVESNGDTAENLKAIRANNMKAGLAVKPGTPVEEVYPYLPLCDMILVMTVEPGYGGQGFIPYCADKVKELRSYCDKNNITVDIQVDGGINADTADIVKKAGANVLVAGTYLFKAEDMRKAAELIR